MFMDDWTYVVLVLPAVIFSIWCSARVQSTFKKYSAVPTRRGVTGADAARRVLDANGLTDVRIERVAGNLTDHYDPRTNVIRLSERCTAAPRPPPSALLRTRPATPCSTRRGMCL